MHLLKNSKYSFSFWSIGMPVLFVLLFSIVERRANNPVITSSATTLSPPGLLLRSQLTSNNSAKSESLPNFPVLATLDNNNVDYTNTQNDGNELRFYDSYDETFLAFSMTDKEERVNTARTNLFGINAIAAIADSVSIQPTTKDVLISSDNPTTNYGGTNLLTSGQDVTNETRTLIEFDLSSIPAEVIITSVDLVLEVTGPAVPPPAFQLDIHRITAAWIENSITWNLLGSNWDATVEASKSVSATGPYTWDVTSLVSNWYDGTYTNNGLLMKANSPASGEFVWLASKEHATSSFHPRLVVRYTSCGQQSSTDDFQSNNYSGGSDWIGNWIEIGESDGSGSGDVVIATDPLIGGTISLRIQQSLNGAERAVDLDEAISANLTFEYLRDGWDSDDWLQVYISGNNGSTWTLLGQINGNGGEDTAWQNFQANISNTLLLTTNSLIRLISNNNPQGGDDIYINNLELTWETENHVSNGCLTVNSTGDGGDTNPGDGYCADSNCECTLRAAIEEANALAGSDTICFNIGGGGSQTITINGTSGSNPNGTGLDFIVDPIVIDATTQPGYLGTPLITLDGISATSTTAALILQTDDSTIKGFIITNFNDEGLEIDGSTGFGDNNIIENNWVGIDAAGNAAGNGDDGILVTEDADANEIRNNVVGSNTGDGIVLRNSGTSNNWVHGNIVGLTADTLNTRANGDNGIHLYGDASNNLIGTNADGNDDTAESNIVSGNTKSGIAMATTSGTNTFLGNHIYNNTLLGIDLGSTAGVSYNDVDDSDSGQNDLLNFPVLTNVIQNGANLDVNFSVDLPTGWYRIEFFENPNAIDSSGYGEGEIFLDAKLINVTGAAGYESFSETLTGVTPSQIIGMTATASYDFTGGAGTVFDKTSEFGPRYLGPGTFEVTTTSDVVDGNTTSITTLVGDRGTDGEISLREAIVATNNTANIGGNPDQIHFEITEPLISGVHTITLTGSVLPGITDTVIIDGSTESDYVIGTPIIEINGNSLTGHGIDLLGTSDGSTVRGLIINRFNGAGIQLYFSDNNTIVGNWIGTDNIGTSGQGNTSFGIEIDRSGNNQIGGSSIADRNVIAGNGDEGISIWEVLSTQNTVQGNYIGVDKTGNTGLGNNGDGIAIAGGADKNTIGGDRAAGEGNVISGQLGSNSDGIEIDNINTDSTKIYGNYIGTNHDGTASIGNARHGIVIYDAVQGTEVGGTGSGQGNIISGNTDSGVIIDGNGMASTTGNIIVGNKIGTDVSGTIDLGNTDHGIEIISAASGNIIGGTTVAHRNIISGNNGQGIEILGGGTTGNIFQGNFIGTDVTGNASIRNEGNGIRLNGNVGTIIGGSAPGAGNVVSGNNNAGSTADGIYVNGGSGHIIQGNLIGLGFDGSTSLGNYSSGIAISGSSNNQIGGTAAGAGNIISANRIGLQIRNAGSSGNLVYGNYIGTDATGILDRGNATDGIILENGATNDTIGGTTTAHRNIISGNDNDGIWITGSGTDNHIVQGNWIGLNTAENALGNSYHGIGIENGAADNLVGGTTIGAGNKIANNTWDGIAISGGTGSDNSLLGNTFYDNGNLAIDIDNDGVTGNDGLDIDIGANDLQNFPMLSSAVYNGTNSIIIGLLNSTANTDFRIEYFSSPTGDVSGNGEGQVYLGSDAVTTDGSGNATLNTTLLGVSLTNGHAVSATTTVDMGGGDFDSTSEFAANVIASAGEICNNGIDDDGDGQADCADSDCCCARAPELSKN